MGYSLRLAASVLLYTQSDGQDTTYNDFYYTKCGALAGTSNSSMGPPWRIDPTTPWADGLSLSYVPLDRIYELDDHEQLPNGLITSSVNVKLSAILVLE